jgi:hypothetical protein
MVLQVVGGKIGAGVATVIKEVGIEGVGVRVEKIYIYSSSDFWFAFRCWELAWEDL